MTLRRKATAGVFWVGVSTATNQFFNMLIKYVLARMLDPAHFGLVSMAYIAIDFLTMFREMGFASALIYHRGDQRKAADTTFITILILSTTLFLLAFLGAPLVAVFFRSAELTNVLRALSVNILISALGQVQLALLAKNLAFRERLLPDIVPTVAYGVVAITLALMGMGVWSLVVAKLVDSTLTSLLYWLVVPWWRPRLRFDRGVARELFDYGKHIVGSSLLIYFITNLDNTFVGRVLGEEQLGYYGMAYTQANVPATQISRIIGQVLFPAYSKIQDDLVALRKAYFRTTKYVSMVSIPLSVAVVAFAGPFVNTLYGGSWAQAIVPLQWLGVYGLFRAVAVNMGSVFKAGGRPQWLTYIAVLRLAVMGTLLYPAALYYGIVGVSVLSALVAAADFVLSAVLTNRIIHGTLADYVRALAGATLLSLATAALAVWAYGRMVGQHGFIALVAAGALMVTCYGLLMLVLDTDLRRAIMAFRHQLEPAGRRWMGNGD